MLYVSSRNKAETFTAYRAFRENGPTDGGMFLPFRLTPFQGDDLEKILNGTFHEAVATVLNIFFPVKLSGWDLELCAGRNICVCRKMPHKLIISETWHNPEGSYRFIEKAVYRRLTGNVGAVPPLARTAIRTAMLFGMFAQIYRTGIKEFDIVTNTADYVSYLSACYARKLGLPVNNVLIACQEDDGIWDFVQKGSFVSNDSAQTGLEALMSTLYGHTQTNIFLNALKSGEQYILDQALSPPCCHGFLAAVVGDRRLGSVVRSVFRACGYVLTENAARMHGALMDYRARTGESRETVLFVDNNPARDAGWIKDAVGLTADEISRLLCEVKE